MSQQYKLLDAAAPRTITSSTDATPIVVTATAHGLSTGDRITISGHTTNTNANGTWNVTKVTANTFSLDDSTATGGGAGGNDGCFAVQNAIAFMDGFDAEIKVDTDGGEDAALTVKFLTSNQEDCPDFAAPKTTTNRYEETYLNDKENPAAENEDGDTGFVVAGADDHRLFGLNTEAARWLCALPTAGTEGEVTVYATLFKRN